MANLRLKLLNLTYVSYQTTYAICWVFLVYHLLSLLKASDFIRTCDNKNKFIFFLLTFSIESFEPYKFIESTDSKNWEKCQAFSE